MNTFSSNIKFYSEFTGGFTPVKLLFNKIVDLVETSSRKPRTNFEERFKLCLPYCFQRGDHYNHPKKSLLLNRHYQPLGIRCKIYNYSDYPDDWWIETTLLDSIFPKRLIDNEGKIKRVAPKIIPNDWRYDDCGWVYDDGWCFKSKSSTDYKQYLENVIKPIQSKIGRIPFVVGLPDFKVLKEHNFCSWQYEGQKRKRYS